MNLRGLQSHKKCWRLLSPSRTDSIISQQKGVLQQLFPGAEESRWEQKTFLRLKETKYLYLQIQTQAGTHWLSSCLKARVYGLGSFEEP